MIKKLAILLVLLILPSLGMTADILVSPEVIEAGDILPGAYSCLEYRGRNQDTVALQASGCPGKKDGWIYYDINARSEFVFEWYGEVLFLKPAGTGKNQMFLYRRVP